MPWLTIRSRHKSVESLRKSIEVPVKAVYRHGSTTEVVDIEYEINSISSIENSSSKLKMKECFEREGIRTAEWYTFDGIGNLVARDGTKIKFNSIDFLPVVCKNIHGSRNQGNSFFKKSDFLHEQEAYMISSKRLDQYIVEKYYAYTREYRLHMTGQGCFYACRKMLKKTVAAHNRWYRNDSNCVWITEENPKFDKPINWKTIEEECRKALKAVGLDIGGFDVRVQSAKDKNGVFRYDPDFIIIESNSGCSLKTIGLEKYREILPNLLKYKYKL